jgi:hypothetical protein
MLAFFMALIFYSHVLIVLVCLFVLLQFARLGFCSRDWKSLILGEVVVACSFLHCMLFIVANPVLRLHLGLLVLLGWVLIWCFFLFAQGL